MRKALQVLKAIDEHRPMRRSRSGSMGFFVRSLWNWIENTARDKERSFLPPFVSEPVVDDDIEKRRPVAPGRIGDGRCDVVGVSDLLRGHPH